LAAKTDLDDDAIGNIGGQDGGGADRNRVQAALFSQPGNETGLCNKEDAI